MKTIYLGMAAVLMNIDFSADKFDKGAVLNLIANIDELINAQLNQIIHHEDFKSMEASWRALNGLILNTNFKADVVIDILDVSKDELFSDFDSNAVDITGSSLFKKAYIAEYDQYGGKPYGSMIGLYEFNHTPDDEFWLKIMGKIAAASHAPFISSVSPKFFGCETMDELAAVKDIAGMMNHPRYGSWNALRDSEVAAYIGLTLPRYICANLMIQTPIQFAILLSKKKCVVIITQTISGVMPPCCLRKTWFVLLSVLGGVSICVGLKAVV